MHGPGSHDIEVLAGDSQIRDGEVLTTIAGTVPLTATRVEVSAGTGSTTEAKLVTTGDPAQQYFGAFLHQSGTAPPARGGRGVRRERRRSRSLRSAIRGLR